VNVEIRVWKDITSRRRSSCYLTTFEVIEHTPWLIQPSPEKATVLTGIG